MPNMIYKMDLGVELFQSFFHFMYHFANQIRDENTNHHLIQQLSLFSFPIDQLSH